MAAPPTRRDPPTPDDASAGLGAATLAQLVAAGAAVGPAAMGAVGRGALVGAGSLPAATAHAIAEAVERALDGFWMQQLAKARDRARTVIGEAFPSWTPSLVDKAVAEELAYEDAFRRKSRKRWARDLPAALAHSDPAERRRALQALLDRERRYAEQRYAAVIRRVHARVERERVRDASPLGAYWTMDPRLKTHTPGCVALAGQFWPWAVIDRVHPPVHASCGCRLWSLDDAVRRGWMRPDQVPDEADAVRRAQMLARRIAELHSDLGEAALRELSEAIAKDAAYDLRYPKGTAKGGQYRPRRGYDAGGLIKRHVRRDLRKLLEPPAHASLRDDRENRRVNGRSVSIPWATHWRGTVGGRRYFSPPQSTNVYEEHVPVPRRAAAGIVEDLKRKAAEIVTGRRSEALDSMRARLAKNEPPIAKGDPVDRLSLLPLLGFRRTATNQSSERGRPAVEDHFRSADGRLVTVRRGNAAEGYTDVLGATIEHATGPRAKALKRPPRTFEEFEADTAAYAQRLGELHGRVPGLTDVGEDPSLQDTAAYRDWDGMLRFGPDARAAVEAYAAARREHRQPTADEALGMYIAQATALHEASHAVNPEYEYQFDQPGRRWAEEALAEELATADVGKHLKETGQKAVLRWAADHPDHIQLEGNYHQPRIVLASALDRAGIAPEDREAYLRRLKFDVDPNERLDTLAADMAKHSGTGKDEELRQLAANLDNPNAAPAGAPWTALPALPPEAAELRAGDGPSITVVAQDAQTLGHHGPMTLRAGTRVNVDGEGNGRVMSLDPADGGWTAQVAYEDGNTGFIHGLGSDGYAPTELAIFPPERVNGIEEGARVAWTRPDGKETKGTLDRALLSYPGGGWAFEGVTEDGRRAVVTSSNTKGLRALTPAELASEPVPSRDNPRPDAPVPTSDSIERSPGRNPQVPLAQAQRWLNVPPPGAPRKEGPVTRPLPGEPEPWMQTAEEFAASPATWWHGTEWPEMGGGDPGLVHLGDWQTAHEALLARTGKAEVGPDDYIPTAKRIEVPRRVWREKRTGAVGDFFGPGGSPAPGYEDHYERVDNPLYRDPFTARPRMVPVRIVGPMDRDVLNDTVGDPDPALGPSAESILRGQVHRGVTPRQGYFYQNQGEGTYWKGWPEPPSPDDIDSGGADLINPVSAVVPSPDWLRSHEDYVRQALADGKPVPARVLAEYPGLGREGSPGRASVNNWFPGDYGKGLVYPDGRVVAWSTDIYGNPEHGLVDDQGRSDEGATWGSQRDRMAERFDAGVVAVTIDPDGQVHDAYAQDARDAPQPDVMRRLRAVMGSEVHARQGRAENSPGRATAGLYRGPLYHVADAGQRESIAAHGIDDTRAPYERSTSGAGFYAFADPGEARWYAEYMAPEDPAGPMDVYEVRTDGPVELDAGLGTDGPTSAVRVLRPATGQRLAATYDPRAGWSGDAPDPPATDPRPPELVRVENSPGAVAPGRPGGSPAATRPGDDAEYRIGTAAHAEHLSPEETKALLAYTEDPRKMSDAQTATLAALVARHPLPEPVVAYRKAAPGELDGAKPGDAITEDRLRSASMGPTYGIGVTDDNGSMRLSLPAGTPAYYNPHNDSEHELILPPRLRLRVDSVATSGGRPRVAATAVPPAPPVHGAVADPPGERSPGAVPSAPPLRPEFVEMVRKRREEDAQGLERMANPRKWAHDRGMTDGEYEKAVADHVGGLARSADLVVRLDEKYLPAFLEGHVANQHEVDHSGGMYDPVRRARAEAGAWDIAGAEPDRGKIDYSSPAAEYAAEHPDRFPVYGYLSMGPDRPSPDESSGFYSPAEIGNNAGQYGGAKLVLRPEVKDRTYLFLGDSLGPIQDGVGVPSPALAPSPLSAQVDPLDYTSLGPDTLHFEDPETAGDPAGTETSPWPYTEAEIFGGVRPGDVDHVELAEEPTGELAQQLEKAGVAWTVGQQGAPDTSVSTAVRRRAAAAAKIMGDAGAPYSEAVDEMGNWPITDADRADILKDYPGAADHASVTAREESPGRVQRAVTPAERERLIRAAREAPPKKNWLGQKPHMSGVRRRGFGPTPLALLVSTGQPDMARYATPALGRLLVPGSYGQSDEDAAEGVPFAADNGGFWGVPEGDYKRMAEELSKGKKKPLWVTVPDVFVHPFLTHSGRRIWAANRKDAEREAGGRVREDKATPPHGDADATMARFEQWSQYLRHEGLPAAFVAQDGMDSPERLAWLDRHWGEIEAVFIGGSDEFKLGPGAAKVARLAHEHGKLVHVGRVNTHQRIAYARDVLGADSIDGGTFSKFKDTYLPSGLAYIPTAGAPPTKAGQEWVRSAREALDGEHAWPRPPGRDKPQWPRGFYPLAEAADAGTVGYQELADALSAAGLSDYLHLAFRPGTPGFTVKGTPAQRGWVAAYLGVEAPSGEQWPQLVLPGGDGEGELALAEAYVEGLHPRDRTGRWAPRPWQLNGPWRGAPQGGSTFASDRMARQAFRAPRLDPDQRAALERYRGDEYQEVNDALRGGREASPGRARDDVALMDAAVGASEAAEPVTLYRGLTHAHAIPERGEFVDRGFVSASLTENTATYFSGAAHGTEPHPDQTLAEIRLPAGAHALALAAEVGSAEGEVILPRGSAFRVVGRTTERWTTRSGAPASVTHVVLEYLGSRGGKGLSEARRAPQGASGRFFWAPGDVEPAELEEGLYDEHLHPRGRSGQWVRAFHGGGTNMPHASPVETAAWVEKRLGLPEGSVQNHRWLGFSRDRAHDPWSYWTTDRGMAERYAAIGSEPLDDALTAAYAVIRDIKPDQDTPDHWQRDLTAFKVKFLKDNGIEPHVTERRLTPEDVAASSNYQGYLKNVEASPAKDGKPPLSPEEWLAAANGTGEVTLMLPRADLPAHLADAVRQGGATLDLSTGEQPSEGFAVAVEGHSGITKTEEFLADPAGHYERWLEGNADAVDAAGHVGVWRDDAHGEVVLDPVEVFSPDRRAEAIAAGRGRDQQSIYDLKAGVEIPTGGTGGREDSPGRVPAKLYHSASRAYRESIRRRGILTRDPQGRSKAVEDGTPEGAYLFEHPEDAATSDMSAHGGAPGHDVWEVDARGLRIVADPASELPAWYSPDPIPPDRVRLHDARVPSVSSGWKMLAPGEYEHASGWHISRINYGHGDEWTAVTPDGYALDPLPTLKRARAAAELSIEDERGREQSPGSARDQRKREQAEAAAEWARLAPGDRFEVKSDGSSGPVAIAGYEVVRNDSDAYGPSLRVRDESGRETTFTPDLGSRPHMAGPADGRPFAKGEVVVRPNGKKASVLSVDGDRVTVVYRSGRSNGQQTFRASQLGRA